MNRLSILSPHHQDRILDQWRAWCTDRLPDRQWIPLFYNEVVAEDDDLAKLPVDEVLKVLLEEVPMFARPRAPSAGSNRI